MTPARSRRTVAGVARVDGIGLFSGARATLEIAPAPAGTGLCFESAGGRVVASPDAVTNQAVHPAFAAIGPRNTSIAGPAGSIHTVEHLLAAFAGLGVTDAVCGVEGPEIPIGDGSALPFTGAIASVGLRDLDEIAEPWMLRERIRVEEGDASIELEPSAATSFRYELDYGPGAPIGPHAASWDGGREVFLGSVAPARTFALVREAEGMRNAGMFASFTPRDLLVIGDDGAPVDNAWRGDGEPARHKLLDLIGDLALATGGRPLIARVTARRSGHALNRGAASALASRLASPIHRRT